MLVAISAAHGRRELTRVWAAHTASLGFDRIIVCGTTGAFESCDDLLDAGIWCVGEPNDPLAGKFNRSMGLAMSRGATRIMILPSDDFVSQAWVEAARTTDLDYIVPHTCGIIDLASLEAFAITKLSFTGTLKFGAGRVVSRKAVEACGGQLWPQELNRGLDSASHHRLMAHGIKHTVITTEGIPITDVKTAENLWPFQTWINGSRPLTADQALHMLKPEHRAQLEAIRVQA